MKKIETEFEGLSIIKHRIFSDERGFFIKTYNKQLFLELGIDLDVEERYFSVSQKDVIRGMHFQTPPADHVKMVSVIQGSILDVNLDIRKNSETFGKYFCIEIYACDGKSIIIPKGYAHGFMALEDNTIVEYNQTSGYAPDNDEGIRFDSFGFDRGIQNPIVSLRDQEFKKNNDYISPF
jgi:dTDP-4-dehydrorhamnose 3,5-epimerase/CDP-3, 6-dideoxy-D-glycero-D-glycero-4-hexulose-5-epimerase